MKNPFRRRKLPSERVELQAMADLAQVALLVEMARRAGFLCDVHVNVAWCEEVLAHARAQMISPRTIGPVGNDLPPPVPAALAAKQTALQRNGLTRTEVAAMAAKFTK